MKVPDHCTQLMISQQFFSCPVTWNALLGLRAEHVGSVYLLDGIRDA